MNETRKVNEQIFIWLKSVWDPASIMSLRGILVRTRCAVPEVLVIRAVSVHFVHYCLLLARGGTSVQPHCKCRFAHAWHDLTYGNATAGDGGFDNWQFSSCPQGGLTRTGNQGHTVNFKSCWAGTRQLGSACKHQHTRTWRQFMINS